MALPFDEDGVLLARTPKRDPSVERLTHMGVSENRGPYYSTLNSRILAIRTPKIRYPLFSETPIWLYSFEQAILFD